MSLKNIFSNNSRFVWSLLFVWLTIGLTTIFLLDKIESSKSEYAESLKKSVLNEAIAHYDNIVTARGWNASHGGIFILQHDDIQPNPYLKHNVLKSDDNRTLIKVNPAWMTRQISEISNKKSKHYYRMSSLNPINPINKPDSFEKEALEYFEKNKNEKYYLDFLEPIEGVGKFNFMGSLMVTKGCLKCHAEQGYKVGDVRGGIRITLPLESYQQSYTYLEEKSFFDKTLIVIFGFIVASLLSIYLKKIFNHQKEVESLNEVLEEKVEIRTQELYEINQTLEDRVAFEVKKSRKQDEAMLSQARQVAMGEVLEVIAHQWRQPISIIGLDANNLLVDFELGTDNKENIKDALKNISDETQKLSNIISDVSDIFQTDSNPKEINIQNIFDDALNVIDSSFEEVKIDVEKNYTNNSLIKVVSQELFQVYWNLLNNSKDIFLQRNVANPKIVVEILENETDIITIVSDNGGGIDDKHISKIFEPYFSTSDNLNGKGLGLYVVKVIIEKQLRGTISVKNTDDGAEFKITLPKS